MLVLFLAWFLPFLLQGFLSFKTKIFFYSLGLTSKDLIVFCVPFILFFFIAEGILKLKQGATKVLVLVLPLVVLSNFLSTVFGMLASYVFVPFVFNSHQEQVIVASLPGSSFVGFLPFLRSELALLAGIFSSLVILFFKLNLLKNIITDCTNIIRKFAIWFFKPLLPVFVFGFSFKLIESGILGLLLANLPVFLLVFLFLSLYVSLIFFALSFIKKDIWSELGNFIPTLWVGFSTMSSAVALPIALETFEKSYKNPLLLKTIFVMASNIHLVGNGILSTFLMTLVSMVFNGSMPGFWPVLNFIVFLVLMKFAASGVPGGGAYIVTGLLSSILNFSPEMISMFLGLYLIFDSFNTVTNVLGNLWLTFLVEKIVTK